MYLLLLLSLSYGSIFFRLDVIKLSLFIINLILSGIIFFNFKKCRKINRKTGVYLFTTIYLLILSNLLEHLWVGSRITSLSGDVEINPGPKLNALNQHTVLQKFLFYQHIVLSTNLILFASLKLIWIPKLHLTTKIWK